MRVRQDPATWTQASGNHHCLSCFLNFLPPSQRAYSISGLPLRHCGSQVPQTKRTTDHQGSPKVRGDIIQTCPQWGGAKDMTWSQAFEIARGGCFQILKEIQDTLISFNPTCSSQEDLGFSGKSEQQLDGGRGGWGLRLHRYLCL